MGSEMCIRDSNDTIKDTVNDTIYINDPINDHIDDTINDRKSVLQQSKYHHAAHVSCRTSLAQSAQAITSTIVWPMLYICTRHLVSEGGGS